MDLLSFIGKRIAVMNGAMGTFFQGKYPEEESLYLQNVTRPELIKSVQKQYLEAGADLIEAVTFTANRHHLSRYGLGERTAEINKAAIAVARDAVDEAGKDSFVFASIGEAADYIMPLGKLSFHDAYELYSEQVHACSDADFILFETFSDIRMLKAALLAAKDHFKGPVIASMTFEESGRTSTGTDPLTLISVAGAMGASVIGANCSTGPREMLAVAEIFSKKCEKPFMVKPNAGMPRLVDGRTVFDVRPEEFVSYYDKFLELGASIAAGCCGTTPEHIRKVAEKCRGKRPVTRDVKSCMMLSSRTRTIELSIDGPQSIIGERINPTNRKALQEKIRQGDLSVLIPESVAQEEAGADMIDINLGMPMIDEAKILKSAVSVIQERVQCPLVIDTTDPEALEDALIESNGRPLVNSANAGEDSGEVFRLAKRYGAALICLCVDEKGVAATAEEKVRMADKLIAKARENGLSIHDIMIDTATLAVATDPDSPEQVLTAVAELKEKGFLTVLGVSNISHGLPQRIILNSQFMAHAFNSGLSCAIANPLDARINEARHSYCALFGKDEGFSGYIKQFSDQTLRGDAPKPSDLTIEDKLQQSLITGDASGIRKATEEALLDMDALDVNRILIDAMSKVGADFRENRVFLPQVMASAAAMKEAFSLIESRLEQTEATKGTIVIASVKNDVHDIGKNIVIALLQSHGYRIIDLGTSVDEKEIVKAAKEHHAGLVALSALMTTTMKEMPKVVKLLREEGLEIPVIIGGAVVSGEFADSIGAGYARDALAAIDEVKKVF